MNRFQIHNKKVVFLLLLSLCLQIKCEQVVDIGNNNQCDEQKPYYRNYFIIDCIVKDECERSDDNIEIYLTGYDQYFCANTDQYCQPEIKNQPGYYRVPNTKHTECLKCPVDQPISDKSECGQCPEKKIFTYVALSGQTGPCVSINEIQEANDKTGVFDTDFKIYYESDYSCPKNSLKSDLTLRYLDGSQTFKKCEWCPLDKPVIEDGTTNCAPCQGGQIADEETHTCIDADKCQNILSNDEKICYKSKCPLGYAINKSTFPWKCVVCSNRFPSADQTQCLVDCNQKSEILHEATSSCIRFEDCDGFYSDNDKTTCLKNSCQRVLASFSLPASIVDKKADDKTYQECSACPVGKEFVKVEGQDPTNKCQNCSVDNIGTVSDFITGVCIALEKIKQYGILNEDSTIFYPADKYTCKSGYFLSKRSNSFIEYGFCDKCPSHFPVSDGITCTNTCPENFVADYYSQKCVSKEGFQCKGRYSVDELLCSPVCKPGEKTAPQDMCATCDPSTPNSLFDFSDCVNNTLCYLDFELQTCMEFPTDCEKKGIDYFYQKNTQTCKKGCGENELKSKKANKPYCIDLCTQYTYFEDGYQYCQNTCKEDEFAIVETKICKKKTECSKFITGTPSQCLETCLQGEVILDEKLQGQTYTQCVVANQCETALVEQDDTSFICTKNCKKFVNAEDRKCVEACPTDFYQDSQKNNSNYYICYKNCPAGKLQFISPLDGKKYCIQQSECTLNVSSDKTMCTADCLIDETANQNGELMICELNGFDCGSKQYQYLYKNYRICSDICNHFMSGDQCYQKCPNDAKYVLEKNQSETFLRCTQSCEKYFFLNNDGNLECSYTCSTYLDIDNQQCLKTCYSSHYILEKEEKDTFQGCSVDCTKIKYMDDNNIKFCVSSCSKYLQTETQTCVTSCQPTEFTYDKVENETYTKCSSTCDDIEYTDNEGTKRCVKNCSDYLSPNKRVCKKSCGSDEFINEKAEGENYFQCSNTCPESTYQYVDDKGLKYCIKECNTYLSSSDKKVCLDSCPLREFVNDKKDKTYQECSQKCELLYSYLDEKGIKRCTDTCPFYLGTNEKDCNFSCQGSEYTQDKEIGEIFFRCSATCDSFEYYTEDNIKRCGKTCPKNQIAYKNDPQDKCLKTKKDCTSVISAKGNECILKCNTDKLEYPKNMNGFKQCTVCQGYYKAEDQTCSQSCTANEIAFPATHECFNKVEGENKCKDMSYKLSSDKTKCTEDCEYPEKRNSAGECIPCDLKNDECNNCKPEELIFYNGSKYVCLDSCGQLFTSSDKKRCVYQCQFIRELAQENDKQCLKCSEKETLVVQSENKYICKSIEDPQIFTDILNTAKDYASQYKNSKDEIEEAKNQITEVAKLTYIQFPEKKDKSPQELLNEVIDLLKSLVKSIKIEEFATIPHKIGSKENILILSQKTATGFRYKKHLDFDQILNNSNYSLTEENLDEEQETITSLSTSIIASNPTCKIDACKIYPLFSLDKVENTGRRILQTSQDFTVTFNLQDSTDIKKYICLSYDLSNPTADPTKVQTTIGNDNKSISCLVSGSVSILLDSTCIYINKSLCPKKPDDSNNNNNNNNGQNTNESESDDEELNGGEIAGIVIGVIAFVGVSILIILQIIKQNKIKTSKKYQQPNDTIKHEQFHTEERVNTLGINASEKQV